MSINYPYKRMALKNTKLQEQLIKEALRRRIKIDNVPLFDVNECPCCMEEWGATKISVFVGNKRIKPCVIKRYTHCGHPQ